MSKVNIRFIYGHQKEQEIKSVRTTHRGPVNLSNLYETYANPSYHEIDLNVNNHENDYRNQQNATSCLRQIVMVPTVQVNSKLTSPKFSQNRLKSPETKATQNVFPEQLRTLKAGKTLSPRQTIDIEEVNESQFIKKTVSKKQIQKEFQSQIPEGQIVLKSPSFKFVPKQEGDLNHGNRKEYVRAEKVEKYLYNGIPEKSEDDFIGCFGCFDKKPKTYRATQK